MARRRRERSARVGDIVAIGLDDGSFGFGQVAAWGRYSLRLIVYDARCSTADAPDPLGVPISCLALTNEAVADGVWAIVDHRPVGFDAPTLPEGIHCGGRTATSLLNLLHGLVPPQGVSTVEWDYEPCLLPGVDRERLREGERLARARGTPRAASNGVASPEPVETPRGPAELRVRIRLDGEFPSSSEMRLRHSLEERCAVFGRVVAAGAGEGEMEVVLEVESAVRAWPQLERALTELGVSDRARIDARPIEV